MCKQKRKTRLQVPRPNKNQPLVQTENPIYYFVMGEKNKFYALISHSPNPLLFLVLSIYKHVKGIYVVKS